MRATVTVTSALRLVEARVVKAVGPEGENADAAVSASAKMVAVNFMVDLGKVEDGLELG